MRVVAKAGQAIGLAMAMAMAMATGGCTALGIKGPPLPTAVEVHNRQAMEFYRSAPLSDGTLSSALRTKPMDDDGQIVAMAISGGGMRAAAFTLGVLAELQTKGVLDTVDYFSSNSGGSWGVAAYLADRARAGDGAYSLQDRAGAMRGKFIAASKGVVRCWSRNFTEALAPGVSYGDLYAPGRAHPLPAAFFNAALLPAQAPFVFTDKFIRHYRVTDFHACRDEGQDFSVGGQLAKVPLGFAAATSGSVPGFYYSYADTALCASEEKDLDGKGTAGASYSFCFGDEAKRLNKLHLVDGGLYDNIGYKTALEVSNAVRARHPDLRGTTILVNSSTETLPQMVSDKSKGKSGVVGLLTSMGFPAQDATFNRLYQPLFRQDRNDQVVLLDFFSASGFTSDKEELLTGLDVLADYAAHNVSCYTDVPGQSAPKPQRIDVKAAAPLEDSLALLRLRGGDCYSENFYRVGTLAKTTYQADDLYFELLWELGQLVVRMNIASVRSKLRLQ